MPDTLSRLQCVKMAWVAGLGRTHRPMKVFLEGPMNKSLWGDTGTNQLLFGRVLLALEVLTEVVLKGNVSGNE